MPGALDTELTEAEETIEQHLIDLVDSGKTYIKSRHLVDDLPYSVRKIGVNIGILEDKSDRLSIQKRGGRSDGQTWIVTRKHTDANTQSTATRAD